LEAWRRGFKYQGGYMKRIFFLTALLSLFAFSSQAEEIKIGYVDLNKALNESKQGKDAIRSLEDIVKSKQAVVDKKGDEIKILEEEISKQSSILTPESIKAKQQEHERLLRDYKRIIQDTQNDIQKKQTEYMQAIIADLRKMIMKIGEEENYSAVFETVESGLLYMPEKLDLTEKVIKRFNETYKAPESKK
jgi:outer membrane protein